jgi:hypothetical protein
MSLPGIYRIYLLRVGEKIENKICLLPCFDIDSCHSSISTDITPILAFMKRYQSIFQCDVQRSFYSHRIRTPQDLAKNPSNHKIGSCNHVWILNPTYCSSTVDCYEIVTEIRALSFCTFHFSAFTPLPLLFIHLVSSYFLNLKIFSVFSRDFEGKSVCWIMRVYVFARCAMSCKRAFLFATLASGWSKRRLLAKRSSRLLAVQAAAVRSIHVHHPSGEKDHMKLAFNDDRPWTEATRRWHRYQVAR